MSFEKHLLSKKHQVICTLCQEVEKQLEQLTGKSDDPFFGQKYEEAITKYNGKVKEIEEKYPEFESEEE